MSALCELQELMLLAATDGYAACTESQCWLADSFHECALFRAVKSWSCMYLAHHQPESVNIGIVDEAIHAGFGYQQKL